MLEINMENKENRTSEINVLSFFAIKRYIRAVQKRIAVCKHDHDKIKAQEFVNTP